ncbi:hypothetical protein BH11PSE9_BH11PSE9_17950 [soil metagenome]
MAELVKAEPVVTSEARIDPVPPAVGERLLHGLARCM